MSEDRIRDDAEIAEQPAAPEGATQPPPGYGAPYRPAPAPRHPDYKFPILAAVLSLFPGLGQIYVGYYKRGFVHVLIAGLIITFLAPGEMGELEPLAGMFLAFFWLYNILDAGRLAALYNRALEGGSEPELPQEFAMPSMGGSIVGGAVLIVAGILLLAKTLFGLPLSWIADWWPLAPIGLGAWLLYRGIRDRLEREAAPPAGASAGTEPLEEDEEEG
jgi:hypothetical protein